MSDTAVAILVLPFLIALTVLLECSRVGCTRIARKLREARSQEARSPGLQGQNLNW